MENKKKINSTGILLGCIKSHYPLNQMSWINYCVKKCSIYLFNKIKKTFSKKNLYADFWF